jgi:hypothetical protein
LFIAKPLAFASHEAAIAMSRTNTASQTTIHLPPPYGLVTYDFFESMPSPAHSVRIAIPSGS